MTAGIRHRSAIQNARLTLNTCRPFVQVMDHKANPRLSRFGELPLLIYMQSTAAGAGIHLGDDAADPKLGQGNPFSPAYRCFDSCHVFGNGKANGAAHLVRDETAPIAVEVGIA